MKIIGKEFLRSNLIIALLGLIFIPISSVQAQYKNVWMAAGSLHNWYSSIGSELEEGYQLYQQYGMQ